MEIYTHEEMLDKYIGVKGTPERDQYDAEVQEGILAYKMGETLRAERKRQRMTQRELGEKAGVGESTVSKVENGQNSSLRSLSRIFRALGITDGFLDLGRLGRVAL